ncbi:MAG: hypothetical protein QW176_00535 [Candidatus Bathyarchaeia archaeon]
MIITIHGTPSDFGISLSPTEVELGRTTGNTKTVSIGLLSIGAFSSPVSLSISGLPQGVTASFEASTVNMAPGRFSSSSVTLTCSPSAVDGSYTATITATGGGITHTAQLGITIVEASQPDSYHPGLLSRLSISVDPSTVSPGGTVEIRGRLTGPDGEGVSGRKISLSSDFGWTATAVTGLDGGFAISLQAPSGEGRYIVSASFIGDSTYASASGRASFIVKAGGGSIWDRFPEWVMPLAIIFTVIIGLLILVAINKPEPKPKGAEAAVAMPEGARLFKICPVCGVENLIDAEYCMECGTKLEFS